MTNLLLRLFVKNSSAVNDPRVRESYGNLGGGVGIFCNLILCIIKISVGIITGSMSITADGLNNLSDMGSSVITIVGFRMASKPADNDHPFGHGRIEYISAFIVSALIILVGGELLISSVKALALGESAPTYSVWALIVLGISVFVKLWLYIFNRSLGKRIDSEAPIATAKDSVNDCIASTVILISVAVSFIVELPFNLDAVMALGVGLFIVWSGLSSAKSTIDDLLGNPPSRELIEQIHSTVMSFDSFVGIHDLIVHNYGPGRQFASVHVEVPQDTDIVSAHEQIDLCEKLVNEQTGVILVIHMDPIDVNNTSVNKAKDDMLGVLENIDSRLSLHDFRMTPSGKSLTNLIFDVVMPQGFKMKTDELLREILSRAMEIDPTYRCVITFDNDYTGTH